MQRQPANPPATTRWHSRNARARCPRAARQMLQRASDQWYRAARNPTDAECNHPTPRYWYKKPAPGRDPPRALGEHVAVTSYVNLLTETIAGKFACRQHACNL